jgi:hypothetical protein
MSWNAYTYSILADQRMNQYLREAAGDRLAGEALASRGSARRLSTSPWVRLLEKLEGGLKLGAVWPARPWQGGTHDGGALSQARRGACCRD